MYVRMKVPIIVSIVLNAISIVPVPLDRGSSDG
jgi:hypothetical protein